MRPSVLGPEDESEHVVYDEGDEGQKEHISSATFFSHQPLDKGAATRSRSVSVAQDELAAKWPEREKVQEKSDRAPERSRSPSVKRDREIEVSIKSEDETQHLHGDLPPLSRASSHEGESSQTYSSAASASASETEFEPSDNEDWFDRGAQASGTETPRPAAVERSVVPKQPRAIELNPFNHQVGGHTALYRISRHAVCKKLNNRENKFYETVEHLHPELLDFMPR